MYHISALCTCVHYMLTDSHQWLLSDEVDLLPALLLPLAGPETFEEEEMEGLPPDLQYLPDYKQREVDPGIRKMCLEAVMKVCIMSVDINLSFLCSIPLSVNPIYLLYQSILFIYPLHVFCQLNSV